MSTFIKLKRVNDTLMLIDLSIVEGFYENPHNPNQCLVYYKSGYTPQNEQQTYALLAHNVTEIANAIYAQSRDIYVVDLTMDELVTDNQSDEGQR